MDPLLAKIPQFPDFEKMVQSILNSRTNYSNDILNYIYEREKIKDFTPRSTVALLIHLLPQFLDTTATNYRPSQQKINIENLFMIFEMLDDMWIDMAKLAQKHMNISGTPSDFELKDALQIAQEDGNSVLMENYKKLLNNVELEIENLCNTKHWLN